MCYERTFSIEISSMSFWSQSRKPKYESSPRLFFFSPSAQIQPGHTKITRARRRFTELLKKNYKSKKGSEYLKVITNYGNIATICYESKYIVIRYLIYVLLFHNKNSKIEYRESPLSAEDCSKRFPH